MSVPRNLCCAVDFSETARDAMRSAAELAQRLEAKLTLVHVVHSPSPSLEQAGVRLEDLGKSPTGEAERAMADWCREASAILGHPVNSRILMGDPHHMLVAHALEERYDLIVAAMNRHRGLKDRVLGSVAERLILDAPCPVLIDRPLLTRAA